MKQTKVKPVEGKLGILVVGCGAVATTLMTGVLMARRGLTKLVGSMTQMDKIRVGRGEEKQYLSYADIVPMTQLDNIVFGTWDVYPQNAYRAAMYAKVLEEKDIAPVREELEQIVPMPAAFDKEHAAFLVVRIADDDAFFDELIDSHGRKVQRFREYLLCASEFVDVSAYEHPFSLPEIYIWMTCIFRGLVEVGFPLLKGSSIN